MADRADLVAAPTRDASADDAFVRPAYDEAWVGGIVPALLGGEHPAWMPSEVVDAAGVVLVVLDGVGWQLLRQHRAMLPVLSSLAGGPITTCAPSTTAAALTSIATGVPPSEHGLAGYRVRVGGAWLNVLQWPLDTGPDPATTQPVAPFLGQQVPVVTRSEFRRTGFTEAHLRGVELIGWRTSAVLVEHVVRLAASDRSFVYAYYDGVDKVAHEYGLRNGFVAAELARADAIVGEMLRRLPPDWALVVTADHGQVHVDRDAVVALDDIAPLLQSVGGEGRFRSLSARSGRLQDLQQACVEAYGDIAWVFSRDELFDEGLLGPSPSLTVRSRVGDVVLAARADVMFVDPALQHEALMLSHHGSLTAAEMYVPLLAGRSTPSS